MGFGRGLKALAALLGCLEPLFSMLAFGVVFKVLLEASGLHAGSILKGLGRILGGLGRDFRAFWAILVYYRLFSMTGLFLADFRKIFAGAPCCLLLLC